MQGGAHGHTHDTALLVFLGIGTVCGPNLLFLGDLCRRNLPLFSLRRSDLPSQLVPHRSLLPCPWVLRKRLLCLFPALSQLNRRRQIQSVVTHCNLRNLEHIATPLNSRAHLQPSYLDLVLRHYLPSRHVLLSIFACDLEAVTLLPPQKEYQLAD